MYCFRYIRGYIIIEQVILQTIKKEMFNMTVRIPSKESLNIKKPSQRAITEINKRISEGNKPVKKPFPYTNLDFVTIK